MSHMETKNSAINRAMAAEIKGARAAAGLTVEQLSKESGLSVATLNRMSSNDIRDINITQIAAIAHAVGISPAELLQRAERRAATMSDGAANVVPIKHPRDMTGAELDAYSGAKAAHSFDAEADAPED